MSGLVPSSQVIQRRPALSTSTALSLSSWLCAPGTRCTVQVVPLSLLTLTAGPPPKYSELVRLLLVGVPPHPLRGTYAVPSAPTLMCPCRPEQAPPSAAICWSGSSGALVGVLEM